MQLPKAFELEKWVWTEVDFDSMGWHDASVYQWRLDQELVLDIDYIFQWTAPEVKGISFTFWVAPATLAFSNVREVEFDFDLFSISDWKTNAAEIEAIEREAGRWTIQFQHGYISYKADGYRQYIRQSSSFQFGQQIEYQQRGGSSLEAVTGENQQDAFSFSKFRKSETWRLYEVALDRARVHRLLDALLDDRAAGRIELKDFLQRKRDFQDRINYLGIELRGAQFENR